MKSQLVAIVLLALAATGCTSGPLRPGGDPVDLSGHWRLEIRTGADTPTLGAMTLASNGPDYRGTVTTNRGNNVLPVTSLVRDGSTIHLRVESPQGEVVFDGELSPTAESFEGTLRYHTGDRFPMTGSRVPPPATAR